MPIDDDDIEPMTVECGDSRCRTWVWRKRLIIINDKRPLSPTSLGADAAAEKGRSAR